MITTSLDSVIRTFDIPTGALIDAFRTDSVASSLTFAPTGDFLATAHVDSVGIALWANRAQFVDVSLAMTSAANVEAATKVAVPLPVMEGADDEEADEVEKMLRPEAWVDGVVEEPEKKLQLGKGLVTLSAVPRSRWQTLLNLETIKVRLIPLVVNDGRSRGNQARNKPREPPKAPERAPFFIPTVPGTDARFDLAGQATEGQSKDGKKRKLHLGPGVDVESEFTRLLDSEPPSSECPSIHSLAHRAKLMSWRGQTRSFSLTSPPCHLPRSTWRSARSRPRLIDCPRCSTGSPDGSPPDATSSSARPSSPSSSASTLNRSSTAGRTCAGR